MKLPQRMKICFQAQGPFYNLRRTIRVHWAEEDTFERPHFAFVAPDRLVISPRWVDKMIAAATELSMPSGKILSKLKLPQGALYPAADSGFVIVHPYGRYTPHPSAIETFAAAGFRMVYPDARDGAIAVEMSTGEEIATEAPALDVLGSCYVAELPDGGIGLFERGKGLESSVPLGMQ